MSRINNVTTNWIRQKRDKFMLQYIVINNKKNITKYETDYENDEIL